MQHVSKLLVRAEMSEGASDGLRLREARCNTVVGKRNAAICYKIDHNKSALLAFSQLRVAAWSDRAWEGHSATADSDSMDLRVGDVTRGGIQ